jgi:hypothetical protein
MAVGNQPCAGHHSADFMMSPIGKNVSTNSAVATHADRQLRPKVPSCIAPT